MASKVWVGSSMLLVAIFLMTMDYGCCYSLKKSGTFKNCGSVPFNISWSPEPLSPSSRLTITYNYTLPYVLDGGTYNITIWFHGDPDPFLQFASAFNCNLLHKEIPCPIFAGAHFRGTKVFEHIPNIGSYPGDYDVMVVVKNKEGKLLICMKGHLIISKD